MKRPEGRQLPESVWIDFLNGRHRPHVRRLREILGAAEIAIGDLMLCEFLQGLGSERAAREAEALLRRFEIVRMAGDAITVQAAPQFPLFATARHHHP